MDSGKTKYIKQANRLAIQVRIARISLLQNDRLKTKHVFYVKI